MAGRFKRSNRTMRKRRTTRKKLAISPSVKKYVQRAIHNNIENKIFTIYGANQTLTTLSGSLASSNGCMYLLPVISQGVGHAGRIANDVKIRSAVVRGHVNLLPYDLATNPKTAPVMVKMWLVSFKKTNTNAIADCNTGAFFEAGSGSASFQGNMLDMVLSNNKDVVTVYKTKKFKLGASFATSTGPISLGAYFDNSPMSVPFYFNYAKYFKGTLKYNDTVGNIPENRNCWLLTQTVYADGTSTAINCAEMHYNVRVEYEDA